MSARQRMRGLVPVLLFFFAAPIAGNGCEEAPCYADSTCEFECPAGGLAEANASLSKITRLDEYFEVVLDFGAAARDAKARSNREIAALGASLGLSADASGSQVEAALSARIAAATAGGITVHGAASACAITAVDATLAAVRCEGPLDDGSVVSCDGACPAEPGSRVDCDGHGTVICRGTAPFGACAGTCTGDCALTVAAPCDGRCEGECTGTCSVVDALGACRGACEGLCRGTCALPAGGACEGACGGSCDAAALANGCLPSAEARCVAAVGDLVVCTSVCVGDVVVTEVSEACSVSSAARRAMVSACAAPAVQITYQVASGLDAAARADFEAWIRVIEPRLAALFAAEAKVSLLQKAAPPLAAAAREDGAVTAAAKEAQEGDLAAALGAGCALAELPKAPALVEAAEADLATTAEVIAGLRSVLGL